MSLRSVPYKPSPSGNGQLHKVSEPLLVYNRVSHELKQIAKTPFVVSAPDPEPTSNVVGRLPAEVEKPKPAKVAGRKRKEIPIDERTQRTLKPISESSSLDLSKRGRTTTEHVSLEERQKEAKERHEREEEKCRLEKIRNEEQMKKTHKHIGDTLMKIDSTCVCRHLTSAKLVANTAPDLWDRGTHVEICEGCGRKVRSVNTDVRKHLADAIKHSKKRICERMINELELAAVHCAWFVRCD